MRYLQPGSVVQAVLKLELKVGCGGFIQLRGAEGHEDEADEWVAVRVRAGSGKGGGRNDVQIEEKQEEEPECVRSAFYDPPS